MFLLSQMATYLLAAFGLGLLSGYGLWRVWGEHQNLAKYQAAERRLAEYLAQWQRQDQP